MGQVFALFIITVAAPWSGMSVHIERMTAMSSMDAATWGRIFAEASALGVLQVHLSGGEPTARRDLPEILRLAVEAGLYTNLITSGVGLTEQRLTALKRAGLTLADLKLIEFNEAFAAQALAVIKETRPDLIILDLLMPGTNGFDVLDRLDAERPVTEEMKPITIERSQGGR